MGSGDHCFAHDPAKAAQRDEARRKGGQGRATRARLDRLVPATLRPMIGELLDAMQEVHTGTLDPERASAMAALAGAITRAYGVGVLEERVQALESTQEGATDGMNIVARIDALERRTPLDDGSRIILIETGPHQSPAEQAAIVADARRRAGPRGLIVEAVDPGEGWEDRG